MLLEKQIMEQHLQETAGDLEFAERQLSSRGSPIGTPPRGDSDDGSPKQQTPSLRQVYTDDTQCLREENERIMEVCIQHYTPYWHYILFPETVLSNAFSRSWLMFQT